MRPLYCDESIWIPVADGLRRRGWAVLTARDKERLGDSDRGRARPEDTDWDPNAWRSHLWRRWVTHLGSFRVTPLVSPSETDPSPHLSG
jgi:hypothetical protein